MNRVGCLGLHDGLISDHVLLYADLDEKLAFQGQVNRPVRVPCREFLLAQANKCEAFVKEFRALAEEHHFEERAKQLQIRMAANGATPNLVREYHVGRAA